MKNSYKMLKMHRYIMLFFVSLLYFSVNGQTTNQNYDISRSTGSFYIDIKSKSGVDHINVNYVLSPKPFSNVLKVNLNTPDPMYLGLKLVDMSGKVIASWKPENTSYKYMHEFDVAELAKGKYKVDVYNATSKVHSISFEKE